MHRSNDEQKHRTEDDHSSSARRLALAKAYEAESDDDGSSTERKRAIAHTTEQA